MLCIAGKAGPGGLFQWSAPYLDLNLPEKMWHCFVGARSLGCSSVGLQEGFCRNVGAVGDVEQLLVPVSLQHAVIFPMQTGELHVNIHHGSVYLKLKRCKSMQTAELRLSYKQD